MDDNTRSFVSRIIKIHGSKYNLDKVKYTGSKYKVIVGCSDHGDFEIPASRLLMGKGCPRCMDIRAALIGRIRDEVYRAWSDSKLKISQEEFVSRVKKPHPELIIDNRTVYKRGDLSVTVKCKDHGYFDKIAVDLLRSKKTNRVFGGCPVCSGSAGERRMIAMLDTLGISYIKEYKIEGSRYRYDCYLPKLNILLEYDGIQHYKPVDLWGGVKYLREIQASDKAKDELAKLNNITLIRIPYTRYGDLEKYLLWMLSKHYKYYHNKEFYKTFKEFSKDKRFPTDATVRDYDKYKTINIKLPT